MIRSVSALCLLLALPWSMAQAQHPPLTARTDLAGTPPDAQAPGPSVAEIAAGRPSTLGDTTRALLRLQAEGTQSGKALPVLGDTASRSYQRYLDSFEHPIPEYFDAALPTTGGTSNR